jgi:hypothetical protein
MNRLHIYAQPYNHSDAWIVGDTEALIALRDALNKLIDPPLFGDKDTLAGVKSFCNDGEGYTTLILKVEDDIVWDQLTLPYNEVKDQRQYEKNPYSIVGHEDYKRVMKGK